MTERRTNYFHGPYNGFHGARYGHKRLIHILTVNNRCLYHKMQLYLLDRLETVCHLPLPLCGGWHLPMTSWLWPKKLKVDLLDDYVVGDDVPQHLIAVFAVGALDCKLTPD